MGKQGGGEFGIAEPSVAGGTAAVIGKHDVHALGAAVRQLQQSSFDALVARSAGDMECNLGSAPSDRQRQRGEPLHKVENLQLLTSMLPKVCGTGAAVYHKSAGAQALSGFQQLRTSNLGSFGESVRGKE